jgi:hypothetical protein
MHVSLGRDGRVFQAGEGSFRMPVGVDEVDNTLGAPYQKAQDLWERNRNQYQTMAQAEQSAAEAANQAQIHQNYLDALAADYEEQVAAESAEENGGEHPLLYAAAMQSMAGGATEQYTQLGGYLLSQDGELAFDRAMNGVDFTRGLGQTQAAVEAATPVPTTAAVPASQPGSSMQVAGIPVLYLAGAAAVAGFLYWKYGRK